MEKLPECAALLKKLLTKVSGRPCECVSGDKNLNDRNGVMNLWRCIEAFRWQELIRWGEMEAETKPAFFGSGAFEVSHGLLLLMSHCCC